MKDECYNLLKEINEKLEPDEFKTGLHIRHLYGKVIDSFINRKKIRKEDLIMMLVWIFQLNLNGDYTDLLLKEWLDFDNSDKEWDEQYILSILDNILSYLLDMPYGFERAMMIELTSLLDDTLKDDEIIETLIKLKENSDDTTT